LHQALTKPVGRKLGGFFVVDVSPRSIVGIPAFAVARDLMRFDARRRRQLRVKGCLRHHVGIKAGVP
jgi:hypothetical protein